MSFASLFIVASSVWFAVAKARRAVSIWVVSLTATVVAMVGVTDTSCGGGMEAVADVTGEEGLAVIELVVTEVVTTGLGMVVEGMVLGVPGILGM